MNPNDKDQQTPDDPNGELRAHVYDGIQEYDKKLPNWWLMTFYGAIVFSIAYWFYFHMTEVGASPEERLVMAQARVAAYAAANQSEDYSPQRLVEMSREADVIERARATYATNCIACHGAEAEGGIGPNLKDDEWMHGGSPIEILASIVDGIPAKGMPGWGSMLGDTKTAELTAWILSFNPNAEELALSASAGEGSAATGTP